MRLLSPFPPLPAPGAAQALALALGLALMLAGPAAPAQEAPSESVTEAAPAAGTETPAAAEGPDLRFTYDDQPGLGIGNQVLMFSPEEWQELEAARAEGLAPKPDPEETAAEVGPDGTPVPEVPIPPPPPPALLPTVHLGGLSWRGPEAWTVWVNGERIDSVEGGSEQFRVLGITPRGVLLSWLPPDDPRAFQFALKPNQTYLPYSNAVRDGRVAADPLAPPPPAEGGAPPSGPLPPGALAPAAGMPPLAPPGAPPPPLPLR